MRLPTHSRIRNGALWVFTSPLNACSQVRRISSASSNSATFYIVMEPFELRQDETTSQDAIVARFVQIEYEDESTEVFSEGEVFYMKPGHTAIVLKDLKLVSFSPEEIFSAIKSFVSKKSPPDRITGE